MDNPENWQQDEEKQKKIVLDTTRHKQTKICAEHHYALANTTKQLEVKTNRTSCLCGNRKGHHNTEVRTFRHIIGQHTEIKKMSSTDPSVNPEARERKAVTTS